MKKLSIAVLLIAGCTKLYVEHPPCQRVYMLSDKYTLDTSYIRTDTLWPWGRYNNAFCNSDTLIFYQSVQPTPLQICGEDNLVIIRYVVGDKITYPHIYKIKRDGFSKSASLEPWFHSTRSPLRCSEQGATQLLISEQNLERSVATGGDKNYKSWSQKLSSP